MSKKTILITGCSDGGLGAALAVAFHNVGWRVFASARNVEKMAGVRAAGIELISLDVSSETSLSSAVTEVSKLTDGSLDALLNNAGGGYSMPLTDVSIAEGKKLFDLNVWSLISTTQAFLPLLLKSKRNPMLINHTSCASIMATPFQAMYNASKSAAAMISDNLRLELAPFGIKVIDMKTGGVSTNFFQNMQTAHTVTLPADSMYQVAKEKIEFFMNGKEFEKPGQTQQADVWAKKVVADLTKSSPPTMVWRGANASLAWILSNFVPSFIFDKMIKDMTGVTAVEKALKAGKR